MINRWKFKVWVIYNTSWIFLCLYKKGNIRHGKTLELFFPGQLIAITDMGLNWKILGGCGEGVQFKKKPYPYISRTRNIQREMDWTRGDPVTILMDNPLSSRLLRLLQGLLCCCIRLFRIVPPHGQQSPLWVMRSKRLSPGLLIWKRISIETPKKKVHPQDGPV